MMATSDHRASPAGARGGPGLVSLVTTPHEALLTILNTDVRLSRLRQSVRTAARLHCDALGGDRDKYTCSMVTLTYARALQWQPDHISRCLDRMRHWAKRRGHTLRFCWVAEIQLSRLRRSGHAVVHYHVLIWLPRGVTLPHADTEGWWPHGMTNTKEVYAPVKYAVKYTSKGTTDVERFPKGARLHGIGGLCSSGKIERRWWCAPRWVRDQTADIVDICRPPGGGIVVRATGELLRSPWVVSSVGRGFVRVRRLTEVEMAQRLAA